ncbi:homogentisate phytyltransferase 1, chloroplastic-like [Andrographis paniculata]|uniref:homogentisate phytyltransferase 1, chloroplastic-like n=1 Tax=Andrographis paniculata TaxID=175694 RepID=UPI0021E8F6F2|nr:homogentisate phytyltransferase 1, chloroplastic-like [Andrographis paniculata]
MYVCRACTFNPLPLPLPSLSLRSSDNFFDILLASFFPSSLSMEALSLGSFRKPSLLHHSLPPALPPAKFRMLVTASNFLECKGLSNVERLNARQNLMMHSHSQIGQSNFMLNPRLNFKCLVKSTPGHPLESEPSGSPWKSVQLALDAFYRFSRPHTVIGTVLSIISVSLLAVENVSDFSPAFFSGVLEAIVAAFFMNIYIVGLNQLCDIDIDKVNKPYLPLASGEYSVPTGVMIISSFAILSFWVGAIVGSWPLFWALFISFILGTAYSINVPFFRWKRFAVVAAMCIFAVRAVIVQIAFYLHVQMHVYSRPPVLTKPVIFATAFMSFFSVVIALFKDIPDIVGDKIYGIQSFTVRLGQERVFWICILLLEIAYAVAILVGAASSSIWSRWTTVVGHILLGFLLWSSAKSIDLNNKASITAFYMFIWKLFYAEYLLIPLIR